QRQCAAQISIFPGWSLAGGQDAGAAYRTPAAYKVTGEGWTMDKEDLVLLPSGRKGRIYPHTRIDRQKKSRKLESKGAHAMEQKKTKKRTAPPRYDDAFKAGAVRLVTEQGR